MRTLFKVVGIFLTIGILGACGRTAPVYNVDRTDIVASTGKEVTADQVNRAIKRAGAQYGWVMKDVGDGNIEGTIHVRQHMAKIDITYSPTSYSIKYKDSKALKYDGTNIHSNYNGWVQRLHQRIQVELSTL